jgi:kinesin family member C1
MSEYIKKLRACIRWFMDLEDGYLVEQEKLRASMDAENTRHADLGKQILFLNFLVMILSYFCSSAIILTSFNCCLVIAEAQLSTAVDELKAANLELTRRCESLEESFNKEHADKLVR